MNEADFRLEQLHEMRRITRLIAVGALLIGVIFGWALTALVQGADTTCKIAITEDGTWKAVDWDPVEQGFPPVSCDKIEVVK